MNLARMRSRVVDARILFERIAREKEKHELTRHVGHRHFAEAARLFTQSFFEPARVAYMNGVQRRERRRIVAVRLLHHAFAGLLEHDASFKRIALEQEARWTAAPRSSRA